MNGNEAFELELGRWLQEGPDRAPREPIAAALATVRAHPERPRTLGSLWRQVMSGIGLTHVPSQPRRTWVLAAAAAAVVIVVAGGYGLFNLGGETGPGSGQSPTPVVTPTPSPAPTEAATPKPTRTPTPTLGPGMSTGVQTCVTATDGVGSTIDEVDRSRGEIMECNHTSTDPRLAGEATLVFNWDEHPDGLWLGWGTIEIRNDGGTWAGSYAIESTSSAGVMEFDSVWIGSGGYEGLEVLNHIRITSVMTSFTSRVFEAGPVVTGTETCTTTVAGREIAAGELTAYRGVSLRCTDTMDDARVGGTNTLKVSIDKRVDESADIWGTVALNNEDGAWEGFFFGTVDPGYTTHRAKALLRGTGAYEGLFYRLEVLSPDGANAQLSGEIIPAL